MKCGPVADPPGLVFEVCASRDGANGPGRPIRYQRLDLIGVAELRRSDPLFAIQLVRRPALSEALSSRPPGKQARRAGALCTDSGTTPDPDGNPKAIKAKRPDKRVKLFGAGKLNRLILDALRRAGGPLSTQAVIDAVVADVGFGPDAAAGMRSRVRSNLLYLSKVRGLVVKEGERQTAVWKLP